MYVEMRRPDGTTFRALGDAKLVDETKLEPGYSVVGPVLFCDAEGKGGLVSHKDKSILAELLDAHGDELLAWFRDKFEANDAADAAWEVKCLVS
jgi:hypothetical protein